MFPIPLNRVGMANESVMHQTRSSKVGGLSSLFNQSIRRSRSFANLQKISAEDLKSRSSLSVHQEEPEQPTLRPKPRTLKTSPHENDNRAVVKRKLPTPNASSTSILTIGSSSSSGSRSKDGTRTPSPPARPAPAPKLWSDDELSEQRQIKSPPLSHQSSFSGLETSVAPKETLALSSNLPSTSPYVGTPRTMSPRSVSPRIKAPPRTPRERSLAHRRKHSVSELTIDRPMSTVKEQSESPFAEVKPSAKKSEEGTKPEATQRSLTLQRQESDDMLDDFADDLVALPASIKSPTAKSFKSYRRSSILLPGTLAPLLIPDTSMMPPPFDPETMILPSTKYVTGSPVELAASPVFPRTNDDKPPEVPPKSPRTLNRRLHAARPPLSASASAPAVPTTPSHAAKSSSVSSTLTPKSPSSSKPLASSHTANTSISSINATELPAGPTFSPKRPHGAAPEPEALEALEATSAPAILSPLPFSMHDLSLGSPLSSKTRKPSHIKNNFSMDGTSSIGSSSRSPALARANSNSRHQRNASDSIINRGRPKKRSDAGLQRSVSRGLKLAILDGTIDQLPTGFSRTSVTSALTNQELVELRQAAELQAVGFEILPGQSIEDLAKELSLLEDHCTTLRRTAFSLRESRKALHDRLIAFLNAPGNAFVSREHFVKQSSSMADLDASIDEYTSKLEVAQARRFQVQRKLFEHTAGVLSLHLPSTGPPGIGSVVGGPRTDEQTPPRSPVSVAGEGSDTKDDGSIDNPDQLQRMSYTAQVQALQKQRKRESDERRERLRQIELIEREQEALEGEFRQRKASAAATLMAFSDDSPRASTQTIQIYADKGLAGLDDGGVDGLLASIEQQIDDLDRRRRA